MKFTITLLFAGHVPLRFASCMAHLLQPHSYPDIDYDVIRTEVVSGRELRFYLDIRPTRFAPAITDAQMRRSGIVHPARSRATTAALLWIATLYDRNSGPLIRAWAEFCGSRTTPMPFTLFTYDLHVSAPSPKNMTAPSVPILASYDGTTQTPTRV